MMIISDNRSILKLAQEHGIEGFYPFKSDNFVSNVACMMARKIGWGQRFFYKKLPAKKPKWVIVFDSRVTRKYLHEVKKAYPDARLIFWYWNDVRYALAPEKVPEGFEKWSYSETDCQKYGLKFNTQFLITTDDTKTFSAVSKDVFYVGRDKNRLSDLLKYQLILEEQGLDVDFHIVADRNHFVIKNKEFYKPAIPYSEVVSRVKTAKAVFDYYEYSTMGLSLRPLEALLYQKKLITNNVNITNYSFYHPNNIFLLGKDDIKTLRDFLKLPFVDTQEYAKEYNFENWIGRFDL